MKIYELNQALVDGTEDFKDPERVLDPEIIRTERGEGKPHESNK